MKAFLSYSINDQDQYLLTVLSSSMRQKGFHISSSDDFHLKRSTPLTQSKIKSSRLFIGILSGSGIEKERVKREWRLAGRAKVPKILLIENTVRLNPEFKGPYIMFDRKNPQLAIDELKRRIETKKKKKDDSNALAWILGGAALVGIISLLSKKD